MENLLENQLVNGISAIKLPAEEVSMYSWLLQVPCKSKLVESFQQPRAPLQISQRIRFDTGALSKANHYWILTVDISKIGLTLVLPSENSENKYTAEELIIEFQEKGEKKSEFTHPVHCLSNIMRQNEDFVESELLLTHPLWDEDIDTIKFGWKVRSRRGRIALESISRSHLQLDDEKIDKSKNSLSRAYDFSELFLSEHLSDICIQCQDQSFPVHRVILAGKSPVFSVMFSHNMRESNEKVIHVSDICPKVMKEMLRFIYTSADIEFSDELSVDLLKASDKYQIMDLKQLCENELVRKLTSENAVEMFGLGDLYGAKKLQDKVIQLLKTSKLNLESNPTYLRELNHEYPDLVFSLIFQSHLQQ